MAEAPRRNRLSAVQGGSTETILFALLVIAELFGVLAIYRILRFYPAPAFSRWSLRRRAQAVLAPASRRERWLLRLRELRRERPLLAYLPYLLLFAMLWAPVVVAPFGRGGGSLALGPFGENGTSKEFIGTLWQVVAAAVGLSVAMIAFAFEAFMGASQRSFGLTLREYAAETRLLDAARLGVLALFLDGAALAGLGSGAPGGWAAIWATLISALTLIAVLTIIERTVGSLGQEELLRIRRRRLEDVVDAALRRQLLTQSADIFLAGDDVPAIDRSFMFHPPGPRIRARRAGTLRDVRLGPPARMLARRAFGGRHDRVLLLRGLDSEMNKGDEVLTVPGGLSGREEATLRRSVRINSRHDLDDRFDLMAQVDRLHGSAVEAIRVHRADEWREIGKLYELVLLELPRTAAKLGVPFEGAVASPGVFGLGPLDRIVRHFSTELELALGLGDDEVIEAILYRPKAIGEEAALVKAYQVAERMLNLQVRFYRRSRRRQ